MGLFERVLIIVVTTIIIAGFLTLVAGPEFGMGAGLIVMGLLSYVLSINIWIIIISELAGIILIARRSTD